MPAAVREVPGPVFFPVSPDVFCYDPSMTKEAERLMAEALRTVKLNGSFYPADVGARVGMDKGQAELAARALANAGILVLGFDCVAEFSPDYRKAHLPAKADAGRKKKTKKVRQLV